MLEVKQIKNEPIDSNCFVIYDKAIRDDCIVVDPGSENNTGLYDFLKWEGLNPQYIILTHEHFDHCWGVNDLRKKCLRVKLICTSICSQSIQSRKHNHSVYHQQPGFELEPADLEVDNINWTLDWYHYIINFNSAQGHTAAGVIFTIGDYLFTGDELIKDIKTVTKLRTGSKEKLVESVKLLEEAKGNGLIVCPGHGEVFELDEYDLNLMIGR